MSHADVTWDAMGSEVRLILEDPTGTAGSAAQAAAEAERYVNRYSQALSRFILDSELCRLNADPRDVVPAGPLLRRALSSALWAAERSRGLVDPTLVEPLEEAGYGESRVGVTPAALSDALLLAPERHPASPSPGEEWRLFRVDDGAGTIIRPPGLRFDTGGVGKGLAADLVSKRLAGFGRTVVNCGGDIRVEVGPGLPPYEIDVEHPLTGEHAHKLTVSSGGVATSGLNVRVWRNADGGYAHHLIDPATRRPAWTGLVGVTALGATALEAETLAKAALLSGPALGRTFLAERGGLMVREDGEVEPVGPLGVRPRLSVAVPASLLKGAAA